MKRIAIILLIAVFFTIGCSNQDNGSDTNSQSDEGPIKIAVTIVPQVTFVEKVGGDRVDVVPLIPPGYSAEHHNPSPGEMRDLSDASLYFTIGVESEESGLVDTAKDLNPDLAFVDLAEEVDSVYPPIQYRKEIEIESDSHDHVEESPEEHGHDQGRDAHIWLSPKRVVVMIEKIQEELAKIDPDNASYYEQNADEYIQKLEELDQEIAQVMKDLPNKTFLMYHPSLGYFADDYGLNMVSIESEGKEATPARLREIVDFAQEHQIDVVFYQQEHDRSQAETLAKEINGETMEVIPLAPNYIENMKAIKDTFKNTLQ